jgi:hypothetical protein
MHVPCVQIDPFQKDPFQIDLFRNAQEDAYVENRIFFRASKSARENQQVDPRACSIICFAKQSGHTGSGTTCHDPSSNFIFITSLSVKPAPHFAHFLLCIRSLLLPAHEDMLKEKV